MLLFFIIIILPFIGWYLFTWLFDVLTGYNKPKKHITNNYNFYDNRQINYHVNPPSNNPHLQK